MPKLNTPSISLVLPAWNEEDYVERSVGMALEVLSKLTSDFEIIVVDDASTDRTPEICAQLLKRHKQVRTIRHARNQKLGAAIKTGFSAARKDVVIYSDIDLPFDLREIERAMHLLEYLDADLICAFRFDRTAEGMKRIAYSFAYNALVRAAFGVHMKDINFSFKVIRRQVLQAVKLESSGSFIDAELVVKAQKLGFKVFQMGVDYFPRTRGISTLASPKVIAKMVQEMVQLFPTTRWPIPLRRTPSEGAAVVPLAKADLPPEQKQVG